MKPVDSETVSELYSSNIEFFRLIAGKYLHIGAFENEDEDVDRAKQRTIDELADWAALTSSSLVLDLGSGTGATAVHLCRRHGCNVTGIDPGTELIEFSKANVPPELAKKLEFQVGRAESLPFKDSFFDFILSIEVLCHADDIDRSLSESARVLKPGGTLVFSDLVMLAGKTTHSDFYFEFNELPRVPDTIARYKQRLSENGFVVVESRDQSQFLRRSLLAGLKRAQCYKDEIISKFGSDKFESIHRYYEQGVRPEFLSEVGWAWFKAVRS